MIIWEMIAHGTFIQYTKNDQNLIQLTIFVLFCCYVPGYPGSSSQGRWHLHKEGTQCCWVCSLALLLLYFLVSLLLHWAPFLLCDFLSWFFVLLVFLAQVYTFSVMYLGLFSCRHVRSWLVEILVFDHMFFRRLVIWRLCCITHPPFHNPIHSSVRSFHIILMFCCAFSAIFLVCPLVFFVFAFLWFVCVLVGTFGILPGLSSTLLVDVSSCIYPSFFFVLSFWISLFIFYSDEFANVNAFSLHVSLGYFSLFLRTWCTDLVLFRGSACWLLPFH